MPMPGLTLYRKLGMSKIDPVIKQETDNTPVCFHSINGFLLSQRIIRQTKKKFLIGKLIV
jgi:hypothetical protein